MFKDSKAFSSFSADDLAAAKDFYAQTLGLEVEEEGSMGLWLKVGGHKTVFIYSKKDHAAADFTVLNLPVDDIDQAVKELEAKGVALEHYAGMTDDSGVARGIAQHRGPDIAWFKDPAGNVVSVLQEK